MLHNIASQGSNNVTNRSHDADSMGDTLTGLDKGTSYVILVAASNTAGMGPFGDSTATMLIDGEWCFLFCLYKLLRWYS